MHNIVLYQPKASWNKGKLVGQKLPLKLEEVWSIRTRLDLANNLRELTMFNLALDCKLRACDFIKLKVSDIAHGEKYSITSNVNSTKDRYSCAI